MKLHELLSDVNKTMPVKALFDTSDDVAGITDNTAEVKKNYIFICVKGKNFDGHSAAEEMLEKGAMCVIADHDLGLRKQIVVSDTRKVYGLLCAAWFDHPERFLKLIGVTGTNGKTTVATLIKDVLTDNGKKVGFIGTTGVLIKGKPIDSDQSTPTTPRVFELYRIFYDMIKKGCDTVVMEVSSFALEQNRIGPAMFEIGIFTNLSQDHLDYHETMDAYFEAKKKLFTEHCKTAVVNIDDDYGLKLWEAIDGNGCERISFGLSSHANVQMDNIRLTETGSKFWISVSNKSFPVSLNMIGKYNISNAAAAIIACLKCNVGIKSIITSLAKCKGVRGRCEILSSDKGFLVVCDYAHSPDALENMLPGIRAHTRGKLICLFGCGGDRDRTKRPLMAQAAEKYADMLVLTSDNPRNEDPEAIINEIAVGLSGTKPCIRITDRKSAIRRAIMIAEKGDTVVLAGKGHEDYQILADDVHIHFDEREIVSEIMHNYKRVPFKQNVNEPLTINEICDAVGGKPIGLRSLTAKINAADIFSDTRSVKKNGMFIALKGKNFDGHDFAKKAVKDGALFALTEHDIDGTTPSIVVKNTRKALLDLARYFRMKFNPIVVGITGSVGKTTTKNMVALALSATQAVMKTEGNFNNEIGLPFTLFRMNSSCTAAVIEMGMSDFGEIERLSKTARPNICLITNIGDSHIENLGSREGILQAKCEIIRGAEKGSPLILNGDDDLLRGLIADFGQHQKIVSYGIENTDCDFVAEDIRVFDDRMYFNVRHKGEIITDAALFCIGRHNIYNALAAIAVAVTAGADPVSASEMLSGFRADGLRQNVEKKGQQTVITDCYNASPTSMKAAIDMLCDMKPEAGGRRVAVLGDMLELGEKSADYHREIGEYIVSKGVDLLVCYGTESKNIAARAEEMGLHAGYSAEKKTVLNFLKFKLKPNDVVLFKASRGMHLEEIIDEFYKDC